MKFSKVDRPSVEYMVRSFYVAILKDDIVGPYFIRKLGNDLSNDKWYEHLRTLERFWLLMVNGEEGYWGHPFPAHAFLGEMYPETFERWLFIFKNTLLNCYDSNEIIEKFYTKAEILAKQFMENLEIGEEFEDED
jgi:hemoglobin